jgi:hypothetical protein
MRRSIIRVATAPYKGLPANFDIDRRNWELPNDDVVGGRNDQAHSGDARREMIEEGETRAIGETSGFLVADVRGRLVGQVECPMYGTAPGEPDALAVRSGLLRRRHFVVPTAAIETIDDRSQVIGLRLASEDLLRFL